MAYTIEACKKAGIFDDIVVSTASEQYRDIANQWGASAPFLRPAWLSGDKAATKNVIIHGIKEMERLGKTYDYIMLLQPTSPLRNEMHIRDSVKRYFKTGADTIVSVCPFDCNCYLVVTLKESGEIGIPVEWGCLSYLCTILLKARKLLCGDHLSLFYGSTTFH